MRHERFPLQALPLARQARRLQLRTPSGVQFAELSQPPARAVPIVRSVRYACKEVASRSHRCDVALVELRRVPQARTRSLRRGQGERADRERARARSKGQLRVHRWLVYWRDSGGPGVTFADEANLKCSGSGKVAASGDGPARRAGGRCAGSVTGRGITLNIAGCSVRAFARHDEAPPSSTGAPGGFTRRSLDVGGGVDLRVGWACNPARG